MPRSLTAEELLELGIACHRNGDYQKAIDAFTEALATCNDVSRLRILDRRAATYEKMNKLESALHDGKYMMKKDKSNPSGYIRAGRTLQQMQKPLIALDIYQYGLRNVKSKDGRKCLREVHNSVHREVYPPRPVDPFEILPQELVLQMLGYLIYKELVILLRVSKAWNNFLKANNQLWTHVDIDCPSSKLSWQAIKSCVYRAGGALKTLEFRNPPRGDSWQKLYNICEYSDQLEELNLWSGKMFTFDILKSIAKAPALRKLLIGDLAIEAPDMIRILGHRPSLTSAKFLFVMFTNVRLQKLPKTVECLSNLEYLVICRRGVLVNTTFETGLLPHNYFTTPNLKELRIHNIYIAQTYPLHKHLKELPLLERLHVAFVKNVEQLVQISQTIKNLSVWFQRSQYEDESNLAEAHVLPDLKELEISSSACFNPKSIEQLILGKEFRRHPESFQSKLRYLKVIEKLCQDDFLNTLLAMKLFRSLNEIELADGHVTDDFLCRLPDLLPGLQFISFRRLSVPSLVLKQIVEKLDGRLRELSLDSCLNMARDAIDWARSKGVNVRLAGTNVLV